MESESSQGQQSPRSKILTPKRSNKQSDSYSQDDFLLSLKDRTRQKFKQLTSNESLRSLVLDRKTNLFKSPRTQTFRSNEGDISVSENAVFDINSSHYIGVEDSGYVNRAFQSDSLPQYGVRTISSSSDLLSKANLSVCSARHQRHTKLAADREKNSSGGNGVFVDKKRKIKSSKIRSGYHGDNVEMQQMGLSSELWIRPVQDRTRANQNYDVYYVHDEKKKSNVRLKQSLSTVENGSTDSNVKREKIECQLEAERRHLQELRLNLMEMDPLDETPIRGRLDGGEAITYNRTGKKHLSRMEERIQAVEEMTNEALKTVHDTARNEHNIDLSAQWNQPVSESSFNSVSSLSMRKKPRKNPVFIDKCYSTPERTWTKPIATTEHFRTQNERVRYLEHSVRKLNSCITDPEISRTQPDPIANFSYIDRKQYDCNLSRSIDRTMVQQPIQSINSSPEPMSHHTDRVDSLEQSIKKLNVLVQKQLNEAHEELVDRNITSRTFDCSPERFPFKLTQAEKPYSSADEYSSSTTLFSPPIREPNPIVFSPLKRAIGLPCQPERPVSKETPSTTCADGNILDKVEETLYTDKVLCVSVYSTDLIKRGCDALFKPVLRVHLVDQFTGRYLKKSDKCRAATSFYENQNRSVDYVQPVMTKPCVSTGQGIRLPCLTWNEDLVFNDDYARFFLREQPVVVIFELLDIVPTRKLQASDTNGWRKIAWAFLKLLSPNGSPNADRKLRLQFYEYPSAKLFPFRSIESGLGIWNVFSESKYRKNYPSTLYVSIKPYNLPMMCKPTLRSCLPTQQEVGTFKVKVSGLKIGQSITSLKEPHVSMWNRIPGQPCGIPNAKFLNFSSGSNGCLTASFSRNGRLLVCGTIDYNSHFIICYEIPSGKFLVRLMGHQGLIYDFDFSCHNENLLLSASADNTAKVWDLDIGEDCQTLLLKSVKSFPHPSFVYAAKFHPATYRLVVTACFDTIIRLWDVDGKLLQELEGHESHVNCLCFTGSGGCLLSGDSAGVLRVWNTGLEQGLVSPTKGLLPFTLSHVITDRRLIGLGICCLEINADQQTLLVQTISGGLFSFSLEIGTIIEEYCGKRFESRSKCCFSTCGNLVFASDKFGVVSVWKTKTGKLEHSYCDLPYKHMVHCVTYHPLDHMVVFASYGENCPVLIYHCDGKGFVSPGCKSFSPRNRLISGMGSSAAKTPDKKHSITSLVATDLEISSRIQKLMAVLSES